MRGEGWHRNCFGVRPYQMGWMHRRIRDVLHADLVLVVVEGVAGRIRGVAGSDTALDNCCFGIPHNSIVVVAAAVADTVHS